jgi:uncharacterized protein with HEPN domain
MSESDRVRLQHMRDAASEALGFTRGKRRENLDADRMLALSLIAGIQIIGEAAARVSPELRQACPLKPWIEIIGMRNRLVPEHPLGDGNLRVGPTDC